MGESSTYKDGDAFVEAEIARLHERAQALEAENERLREALKEVAGVIHSVQDTLLHKVPRSEAVKQQLEINRVSLQTVAAALSDEPTTSEGE